MTAFPAVLRKLEMDTEERLLILAPPSLARSFVCLIKAVLSSVITPISVVRPVTICNTFISCKLRVALVGRVLRALAGDSDDETYLVPRLNKFPFRNLKNFFIARGCGFWLYGALPTHVDGVGKPLDDRIQAPNVWWKEEGRTAQISGAGRLK